MTAVLYRGAPIFTAGRPEWADAILVDGDRILFVGDEATATAIAGASAEVVDLDRSHLVLPGFVDSHVHTVMLGRRLSNPRLEGLGLSRIQEALVEWAERHPSLPRLWGRGWAYEQLPGSMPNRRMLDEVLSDLPVYLVAWDGHSIWLNTAAIEEIGLGAATPDVAGGVIGRDEDGYPSGYFAETAMHRLVYPFIDDAESSDDLETYVSVTQRAWREAGVTSVVDMGLDDAGYAALRRAEAKGLLTTRVFAHYRLIYRADEADQLDQVFRAVRLAARRDSALVEVVGVKIYLDGTIDGCTSAMKHPYADGSNTTPIWPQESLDRVVAAADAAGLRVAIHAIGDDAVRSALDAFEHAVGANGPRLRRHRIEHLEVTDPADLPRLARLGILASVQPVHADPAIIKNWQAKLGDERALRGFDWPALGRADVRLAFGTDTPTAPHGALANLYIASTRRSAIDPSEAAYVPEWAIPLADAIRHATADGAWALGEERRLGALAPGLAADFTVVDRNPFTRGVASLLDAQIVRTVFRGRNVYEREERSRAARSNRRPSPGAHPPESPHPSGLSQPGGLNAAISPNGGGSSSVCPSAPI